MPEDKREEYESAIIKIIKNKVEPDYKDKVTLEATFEKDLGLDSLERVELSIDLNEHFDLHIPDTITSTFTTGRKVVDYLIDPQDYISRNNIVLTPKG